MDKNDIRRAVIKRALHLFEIADAYGFKNLTYSDLLNMDLTDEEIQKKLNILETLTEEIQNAFDILDALSPEDSKKTPALSGIYGEKGSD